MHSEGERERERGSDSSRAKAGGGKTIIRTYADGEVYTILYSHIIPPH